MWWWKIRAGDEVFTYIKTCLFKEEKEAVANGRCGGGEVLVCLGTHDRTVITRRVGRGKWSSAADHGRNVLGWWLVYCAETFGSRILVSASTSNVDFVDQPAWFLRLWYAVLLAWWQWWRTLLEALAFQQPIILEVFVLPRIHVVCLLSPGFESLHITILAEQKWVFGFELGFEFSKKWLK